ncbi:MAG: filamentous hemagglutinin N-terminal domain-containing protein, partial [Rhodocyclales bacterium]|nr:filamentous hemagglutinin N-terminal domain-containing protein [Rhodocyclales bacterium]
MPRKSPGTKALSQTESLLARRRLCALAVAACFASADLLAQSLPSGAQVVNGSAVISQIGKQMTVANSNGAIINWQQFNIGAGNAVRFDQPSASSAVLNRVLASDPSVILGNLTSNGKVWLVNPAGILVGQGARIDTAAFVASTMNVTNADFLANRMRFEAGPAGAGNVVNQGTITTPMGGSVYLIGSKVSNEGIITTPRGETILAAGNTVELIDSATPGVKVEITGAEGDVTNLGEITAEAGRIGIAGVVVKNSGRVSASSVVEEGGRIFLRATKRIELAETSRVGADGTAGGSVTAIVAENGQISGELLARGEITAQGNGQAGSGGFVETSAAKLDIDRITVRTRGGEWLLDPNDIMIQSSGPDTNVSGNPNFTSTADSSIITTGTIQTALNAGTSIIITTGAGGAQAGNITVANAIAKTAGTDATLTLNAHNNINLNAGIGSTTGVLNMVFNANSDATGGGTVNFGTMTLNANGGSISIPGTAFISSGTATLDSTTTIGNLNIVGGGTLTGSGNINVSGGFNWSGNSVISGSGTLTTQPGSTTALSPSFNETIALRGSRIWDNYGTVTFTPNIGTLSHFQIDDTLTGGTAVFNNKIGGVFNLDTPVSDNHITGVGTFNNAGVLNKNLNFTSSVDPAFNNQSGGVVNVTSGTLRFDTGGIDAGNYVLTNNATLQFHGGPRSISGNIGGAGNMTFSKPQTATAVYTLTGDYNVSGTTTAALDDLGSAGDVLFNGTVTNLGSSYVQSGGITNVSFAGITGGAATGFQNLTSITLNEGHLTLASGTSLSGLTTLTRAGGYGSTLDLANNNLALPTLNVTGGTITGSGSISVSGAFAFSKGFISGSGTLTTQLGSTTTLAPGFAQTASLRGSRTWNNFGTVNFTTPGGALTYFEIDDTLTGGTAVFNNQASGVFNINASFNDNHTTGVGSFNNFGLLTKNLNGAPATSGFNPVLINQSGGVINVNSGTLSLNASNTYSAGSSISAASGSTLQFGGGTQTFSGNAAVTGTGATVLFAGGTVINTAAANDFSILNNSTWSVTNGTVNLVAANVTNFANPVAVTGGVLNLNTGNAHSFNAGLSIGVSNSVTFNSADNVTVPSGQTLVANLFSTITGAGTLNTNGATSFGNNGFNLSAKTWNNAGVIDIGTANGYINLVGSAVLNNNAGGSININSGANANPIVVGAGSVNNSGIINKQAGSPATATISASFVNQSGGVVNVNEGTLVLSGSSSSYASTSAINVGAGSTLQIAGGSHSFNSGSAINNTAGTLVFSGGNNTFNSGASVGFDTAMTFSGGTTTFNTGSTRTNTGTVTLSGGILTGSDNFVFNNLVWTNGSIDGSDASTMTTAGTVTMAGVAAATRLERRDWTNLASGIVNLTGTSEISLNGGTANTTTFTNAGVINAATTGTWAIAWRNGASGTNVVNSGTFSKVGAGTTAIEVNSFSNTGALNVSAGTLSVIGGAFTQSGKIEVASGTTFTRSGGFTNAASGIISGAGTVNVGGGANILTNDGTIRPGGANAVGTLSITGNLTNGATGAIDVELLDNSTQYDVIAASGNVTLGGAIKVNDLAGYQTVSGHTYSIFTSGGTISGTPAIASNTGGAYTGTGSPTYVLTATANGAAQFIWSGANSNFWDDVLNWTSSHVPTGTELAVIDGTGVKTVEVRSTGGAQSVRGVLFGITGGSDNLLLSSGSSLGIGVSGMTVPSSSSLTLSGGTLTATGPVTANGNTSLNSGVLNGPGSVAVNGILGLGAVTFNGSGPFNTGSTSVTTLSGSPTFNGVVTWNNSGTVDVGGSHRVLMYNGAVLNNLVGGIINDTTTAPSPLEGNGSSSTFVNTGTFNKNAGSLATQNFSIDSFANNGNFNVNSGTFQLTSSGTDTGTYGIGAGATLTVTAG